jgi:mannose-1-phosphate guanylyltransferase
MDVPGIQIEPGLWTGLNTSIDWNGTTIEGPVYIGSGVDRGRRAPSSARPGSAMAATSAKGAEVVRSVLVRIYSRVTMMSLE